MADDLKRVGLVFKADGTVDFTKSLTQINALTKENYSNFKLLQTQYDKNTTAVDKLKNAQSYLSQNTELYREKVNILEEELKKLENAENRNETAISKKKNELNRAKTTLANYEKGLDEVNAKLASGSAELEEWAKNLKSSSQKASEAGKSLTSKVTAPLVGIGIASIGVASQFEASMSQVAATMGMTSEEINAGSESYQKLEKAAREMGSTTKYSADEAAEAMNYLALAGYDVDKTIEMLPKVLNLASAGNIDLAYASDMVTDSMSALELGADKADEFIDQLAKTSQKSNTNVSQLGEAILNVGGTAKTLADGTTELNTVLGIFADNGIKGAEGGTALRNIILSLTAPTDKAKKQLEKLGVSATDADGNFKPLNETFGDLNSALENCSEAEKTSILSEMFNKVDLKAVNAMLANSGERFNELSGYIDNSKGSAEEMAKTMQNNLKGQLTTLKSALSESAISIGQILMPAISKVIEVIQKWVTWFNNLSGPMKTVIAVVGGIVASIGPLLTIVGLFGTQISNAIGMISKMKLALATSQSGVTALSGSFTALSGPMLAVIATVGLVVAAVVNLWKTNEGFRNNVISIFNQIKSVIETFYNSIIKPIIEGIVTLMKNLWETTLSPLWENIKALIANVTALFQALLSILTPIINTIVKLLGTILKPVISALGKVFSTVFNGAGKVLNTFLSKANSILSGVTTTFNKIKNAIKNPMESAKTYVKKIIDSIKGFFNFSISWPKIKLPHFGISPKGWKVGDLLKGSIPKLSIDWYAKAMDKGIIMNSPTAFGVNSNGEIMAGGEAGEEVVVGKNSLLKMIRNEVQKASSKENGKLDELTRALHSLVRLLSGNYQQGEDEKLDRIIELLMLMAESLNEKDTVVVLEDGTLVGKLAQKMDRELGIISSRKGRKN